MTQNNRHAQRSIICCNANSSINQCTSLINSHRQSTHCNEMYHISVDIVIKWKPHRFLIVQWISALTNCRKCIAYTWQHTQRLKVCHSAAQFRFIEVKGLLGLKAIYRIMLLYLQITSPAAMRQTPKTWRSALRYGNGRRWCASLSDHCDTSYCPILNNTFFVVRVLTLTSVTPPNHTYTTEKSVVNSNLQRKIYESQDINQD